jgi:hypothetical protein
MAGMIPPNLLAVQIAARCSQRNVKIFKEEVEGKTVRLEDIWDHPNAAANSRL